MNKDNNLVMICMCLGMVFGIAIGYIVGVFQGKIGITMCYGLVFGMIIGVGIGTAIKKFKDKE